MEVRGDGWRRLGHTEGMICPRAAGVIGLLAIASASCGGSASSIGTDGGSYGGSSAGSSSGEGANSSSSGAHSGNAGSPGGAESQTGSSSGAGSMHDADTTDADASTACSPSPSGAGRFFGSEQCTTMMQETCGGTTYYATCACPQGTCGCVGPTTRVVNFTGCPYCPTQMPMDLPGVSGSGPSGMGISASEVFALCGFPH